MPASPTAGNDIIHTLTVAVTNPPEEHFPGRPLLLALAISMLSASPALLAQTAAETDWQPLDSLNETQRSQAPDNCCGMYVQPELPAAEESGTTAQEAVYSGEDTILLQGNIRAWQDGGLITGDSADYDRASDVLVMQGDIRVREQNLLLMGMSGTADGMNGLSSLEDASYLLHESGIHGTANALQYDSNINLVTIDNGAFTRCEPGTNTWELRARTLKLDQARGRGYAWHTTLRVKDVPVFYTPWLSFPISDERMTGFLVPAIGRTTDGGADLTTPYYFNLAPNYDATYIPRYMADRGLQHGGEVRYLGTRNREELNATWLGDDKQYDPDVLDQIDQAIAANDVDLLSTLESAPVADRWSVNWQHRGSWSNRWSSTVNYNAVSDMEYFEDFGTVGVRANSPSQLTRRALLLYRADNWDFTTELLGYQTIDPLVNELNQDHDKLPSFTFSGDFSTPLGIDYGLYANHTTFDLRLDPEDFSQAIFDRGLLVEGSRLHVEPKLSYTWSTPGIFFTPGIKYQYTQYDLQRQQVDTDDSPSRGVFTGSVDAGLVFERDLSLFGADWQQTLEPRLYYLYTEYEDQSELPIFDSTRTTFSASQLYRDDRFSGYDRIGDTDQITLGVTSRLLDDSGREKASGSLGQILYFQDREVTLNNRITEEETRQTSSIAAQGRLNISDSWSVNSYVEWNSADNTFDVGNIEMRFIPDADHLLTIALRFRDDATLIRTNPDLDPRIIQSDISTAWSINDQWKLYARFNYDHANQRILESMAGFAFESCCWASRVVYREWVDSYELRRFNDGRYNHGLFFEFELKGFGNLLGNSVGNVLEDSISGYRAR